MPPAPAPMPPAAMPLSTMSIGALPVWLLLDEEGPAWEPSAVGTRRLLLVLLLLGACRVIACCCCCRSWPSRSRCVQKEGCLLEQLTELLLVEEIGGCEKLCLSAAACRKPGRGGSSLATTSAAWPDSDVGSMVLDSQCEWQEFGWPG